MLVQYNTYVIILLAAAILMASFAWNTVRRNSTLITEKMYTLMTLAMGAWSAAYAMQLMSITIDGKLIALTIVYGCATVIPVFWLLFVIAHVGKYNLLTPSFIAPLFIIPAMTFFLTLTAQQHNLIFLNLSLFEQEGFVLLNREFGPWFWVSILYSYALLALASGYLLKEIHRQPDSYRGQSILLFTAMFVPWVSNMVSVLAMGSLHYNLTPVAFTITGVIVGYDLFRLDALDLHPLARDTIFENVNAMVFIIDEHERIRDMNRAVEIELNVKRESLIGKPISHFYESSPVPDELKDFYGDPRHALRKQITIDDRVYDVDIKPVTSRDGTRYQGRVTTMYDITELVRAREAEKQQRQFALALTEGMAALAANLEEGRRSIFKQIIESVGQLVEYDRASIAVINGDNDVTFIAYAGYSPEQAVAMEAFREPLSAFPRMHKLIATKQPEFAPNVLEQDDWAEFSGLPMFSSYIGMPIVSGEEVIGVLNLDHDTPDHYTLEDVENLGAFAAQAAVALANTRLVENLRQSADELAMRNADLDAFSYTVAHDLRAPLNQLRSLLKTLNETIRDDIPSDFLPAFDDALTITDKMGTMIRSLLNIARASGNGREGARPIDLTLVAQEAAKRFINDVDATLHIAPNMPSAMAHPILVEEILANLIGNALKYSGEKPWVAINAIDEGQWVRLFVDDNGPGLSEGHVKLIQEQFSTDVPRHRVGHGLGLSIVHRIVTRLGGQVGYEYRAEGGSRFWFTLPTTDNTKAPYMMPSITSGWSA